MGYRVSQTIHNRGISNGQEALKAMFKVLSHQEIEDQNDLQIPLYTNQNGKDQKFK